MLQLGRARAGAELLRLGQSPPRRLCPLQWGRARAGAELGEGQSNQTAGRVLQWGRARAGAEFPLFVVFIEVHHQLQWGRARAGAELPRIRTTRSSSSAASMG